MFPDPTHYESKQMGIELEQVSTEALAEELQARIPHGGILPGSVYELVTKCVPIVCTDGAAYRITANGPEVLAVRRNTGFYAGKLCLVGGRVLFGESVDAALRRHFSTDLGVQIKIEGCWQQPMTLVQGAPGAPEGFFPEPARHIISLNYLVNLESEVFTYGVGQGGQEVRNIEWLSRDMFPDANEFGYGHDKTIQKVLGILNSRW